MDKNWKNSKTGCIVETGGLHLAQGASRSSGRDVLFVIAVFPDSTPFGPTILEPRLHLKINLVRSHQHRCANRILPNWLGLIGGSNDHDLFTSSPNLSTMPWRESKQRSFSYVITLTHPQWTKYYNFMISWGLYIAVYFLTYKSTIEVLSFYEVNASGSSDLISNNIRKQGNDVFLQVKRCQQGLSKNLQNFITCLSLKLNDLANFFLS